METRGNGRLHHRVTKSKFTSFACVTQQSQVSELSEVPFVRFSPISCFWHSPPEISAFAISRAMSCRCCVDNDKHFLPLFLGNPFSVQPVEECCMRKKNKLKGKKSKNGYEKDFFSLGEPSGSKLFRLAWLSHWLHGTLVTLKSKIKCHSRLNRNLMNGEVRTPRVFLLSISAIQIRVQ